MIFKYFFFFILLLASNGVLAALTCSNPKTECIEAGGIRHFNGVAVTLDCWRYQTTYKCRGESDNNCQQLREQGCSQISAKCRAMVAGTCVVQDETYNCPVERCEEVGDIVCAKKNLFCVGGDCAPTTPTKNKNFDKTISSLAVLAAAAEEVKKQNTKNPQIFVGRPMECSRNIANAKNCCGSSSGGWLEGSILNCDEEEKELAKIKADGRAIEVGEYCYNSVLKKCTSYHRAYCVFDSKIARIVQNDGRKNQLGISLGNVGDDYARLNCRGITPEELSRMNFDRMDFRSIYDEIRKKTTEKIPNNEKIIGDATSSTLGGLKKKSTEGMSKQEFHVEQKVSKRMKEFYGRTNKK